MTDFTDQEISPDSGKPFELYMFVFGPNQTDFYAYTNALRPVVATIEGYEAPVTFKPAPVKREAYKSNGKIDVTNMNIRVPIDTELSNLFLEWPPTQEVICMIRGGHYGMTEGEEFPVIWVGRTLSSSRERNESVLTCSSTIASMKRVGLRRNYQYGCPYVLYGTQCSADKARATFIASALEVTRTTLILSPGWNGTMEPAKFLGGMISWDSEIGVEYRSIMRAEVGLVGFIGPIRGLEVGQEVRVILGCNHRTDDCRNLHQNILNYGGHPWIPLKNPVRYHSFW